MLGSFFRSSRKCPFLYIMHNSTAWFLQILPCEKRIPTVRFGILTITGQTDHRKTAIFPLRSGNFSSLPFCRCRRRRMIYGFIILKFVHCVKRRLPGRLLIRTFRSPPAPDKFRKRAKDQTTRSVHRRRWSFCQITASSPRRFSAAE